MRRMVRADIPQVGSVLYRAFNEVFTRHGYPAPILSIEAGESLVTAYHDYDPGSCLVAVENRRVVGSAFFHRRGDRAGVGPVTIDPGLQGRGIGRQLMERVIDELAECRSIRLFQDAFNRESFALYARLGFEVRDVMAVLRAQPVRLLPSDAGSIGNDELRSMESADLVAAVACDERLTGLVRPGDLEYLRDRGPAQVLTRDGVIRGYCVSFQIDDNLFLGPAAAPDMKSLFRVVNGTLAAARPRVVTLRAPARPGATIAGLLEAGFRIRSLGTYMVRGHFEEPAGVNISALFPETL